MELYLIDRYYQALKKQKYEVFEKDILDQIAFDYDITKRENGSFSFNTNKYGIVDFYPTSNRLLIWETNQWKNNGLKFIEKLK